jgi:2-oxoisovalerate dehydrogenase E1 component beta subunit
MPSGPKDAKGLLISSIRSEDPVIFLEPKVLYRSAVESVPTGDYEIPIGKASIVQQGKDITIVSYGSQLRIIQKAVSHAQQQHNISCEIIDLRTILPWDVEAVTNSVMKTGKCLVSHEAPITCGFGAEVVATVQRECFWSLESPVERVCGMDTPFPLVLEKHYLPNEMKVYDAILRVMENSK